MGMFMRWMNGSRWRNAWMQNGLVWFPTRPNTMVMWPGKFIGLKMITPFGLSLDLDDVPLWFSKKSGWLDWLGWWCLPLGFWSGENTLIFCHFNPKKYFCRSGLRLETPTMHDIIWYPLYESWQILVGGLVAINFIFPLILGISHHPLIDELHHFSGRGSAVQTTNQNIDESNLQGGAAPVMFVEYYNPHEH